MKKRSVASILAMGMAVVFSMAGVAGVSAATEEAGTADFKITLAKAELDVKNETDCEIVAAELEEPNTEAEEEEAEKVLMTLVLTEVDGTEHVFEETAVEVWNEPVLKEEYEILYIVYKDETGKEQEVAEKAEERALEEPVSMWASANVHIREMADKEAESLKILPMGTECTVTAIAPSWFLVQVDELEGYVHHRYLTEDKAAVDEAIEAKRAAEEAAARAAAEAAERQEIWEQLQAQQTPSAPPEKYEVSRETVPNCADGDHGTIYITYSDGSVEAIEY